MQKIVKLLCHIGIETDPVKFLGHTVSKVGTGPDPDKIKKVKVGSQPTTQRIEFCPTPTTHVY